MTTQAFHDIDILQRMVNAVEAVRRRLLRAARALEGYEVPYAVVGGNAIGAWVATVDEDAVRNTNDVDIMVRRADFPRVKEALEAAGFKYQNVSGVDLFLESADATPRRAVHIVYSGEFVRPGEPEPNPGIARAITMQSFRVLDLESLLRIKLTAFLDKDRTHIRDLIGVGLIDQSWVEKLPQPLAARLQSILDTPEG